MKNKRVIVISDVHGSTNWKKLIAARQPGDWAIFLGDYFDRRGDGPFAKSQTENFLEICACARTNHCTYLLVGNHDYNYLLFSDFSGWTYYSRNERNFGHALMKNIDLLQMVVVDNNFRKPVIFVHGV